MVKLRRGQRLRWCWGQRRQRVRWCRRRPCLQQRWADQRRQGQWARVGKYSTVKLSGRDKPGRGLVEDLERRAFKDGDLGGVSRLRGELAGVRDEEHGADRDGRGYARWSSRPIPWWRIPSAAPRGVSAVVALRGIEIPNPRRRTGTRERSVFLDLFWGRRAVLSVREEERRWEGVLTNRI